MSLQAGTFVLRPQIFRALPAATHDVIQTRFAVQTPHLSSAYLAATAFFSAKVMRSFASRRNFRNVRCRAEAPRQPRSRVDPDEVSILDSVAVDPFQIGKISARDESIYRPKADGATVVTATDTEAQLAPEVVASVAEEQHIDLNFLKELLEMTAVDRANLIDDLSRKAFMLIEAGEIQEAKSHLDRAASIAAAFQRLTDELEGRTSDDSKARQDESERTEHEIWSQFRRELVDEDFVKIFGSQAKLAFFIGSF